MKKLIICLALLIFTLPCFGEIYVLVDKNTKEVKGVCENNTAQIEEGMELIVLQGEWGDLKNYGFKDKQEYRKFVDNKFIENTEKINEEKLKTQAKKSAKNNAKTKLKALGLNDDELEALFN